MQLSLLSLGVTTADQLRHGIALFNAARFYDAHEALEDAWRATSGEPKRFLQGLTQAAVALHHHATGNLAGARSVLARAIGNLEAFAPRCCGVEVGELVRDLKQCATALDRGRGWQAPQIRFAAPEPPAAETPPS